jgi:hypothetical protein
MQADIFLYPEILQILNPKTHLNSDYYWKPLAWDISKVHSPYFKPQFHDYFSYNFLELACYKYSERINCRTNVTGLNMRIQYMMNRRNWVRKFPASESCCHSTGYYI